MATTINAIIKESLEIIKKEQLSLTPDTYAKIFCRVAKDKGIILKECQDMDQYLQRLDPKIAEDIKRLHISSMEDFLSFCIVKLNRMYENDVSKMTQALIVLSKRLLQSIALLHNAKATQLANASLERLEYHQNLISIDLMKEKWFEFITHYDDSYLKELEAYGIGHKNDLEALVKEVVHHLTQESHQEVYALLAPLLSASLKPSITIKLNDELNQITEKLYTFPAILNHHATQKELREFIAKRIQYDQNELTQDIAVLSTLLEQTHENITHLVYDTHFNHEQLHAIHTDLEKLEEHDAIVHIRKKLLTITASLEEKIHALNEQMISDQESITKLQKRIVKLESALMEAREDAREDKLTRVATKRALLDELSRVEEVFLQYTRGYTLCLVSIDRFKMLHHTYGQEASNIILASVGNVLRQQVPKSHFIGRFKEEKFLVILLEQPLLEGISFVKGVARMVENAQFLYKNERISIGLSGAVAQRFDYVSQGEMLSAIEALLLQANDSSDSKVFPLV